MDTSSNRLSPPESPRAFGFWLNGRSEEVADREVMRRDSPAHGVPVTEVPHCTGADVDAAVAAARAAFEDGPWPRMPGEGRAAVLLKAADLIEARAEEIAYWEVLESGKPISQLRGEVAGCASIFRYAAGQARALHGESFNNLGEGLFGIVTREPVGVVGIITPWNFPFLILCERVPFVLASGCTILAKPSEFTSASTLMLGEIMKEAGLPDGAFNVVTGTGPRVGQAMLDHADIDMLSFTGSTAVGRECVRAAAGNFKRLALELGGKNPQIVFADADLEDAADGVAFGIGFNAGQCCVSGSRLIVERSVAETFARMVADKLGRAVVGDPLDEATQIGAIITQAQNERILGHIERAKKEGAAVICGGDAPRIGQGRYVAPTVLTEVTAEMAVAREEVFGPVLTVMAFDTMDEAIAMANDTEYGLAASVWSKDIDTALKVTRRVRAGRFWVNTTLAGGPELPLGGFGQSGWGREAGRYGVEEYTEVKSIHVALGKREHWVS